MLAATSCGTFGQSSAPSTPTSTSTSTSTTTTTTTVVDPCSWPHVTERAAAELSRYLIDPFSLRVHESNVYEESESYHALITIIYEASDAKGTLGRYQAEVDVVDENCDELRVSRMDTKIRLWIDSRPSLRNPWPPDLRHPFEICDVDGRSGFTAREVACLHRHGIDVD